MRLSLSNIAWRADEDEEVLSNLKTYGINKIEIAPTRLFPAPVEVKDAALLETRKKYQTLGFEIVAAQSLLFGKPDYSLFNGPAPLQETLNYLKGITHFSAVLGAKPLIFGSPKNRLKGNRSFEEALEEAKEPLRQLGAYAASEGACFCIEPNATEYGCDFVRTVSDAIQLIEKVDHPGVRLNIDLGVIVLNHEPLIETLEKGLPYAAHFHISEGHLALITDGPQHLQARDVLKKSSYKNLLSIEMRGSQTEPNWPGIKASVERVLKVYEGVL